MDLETEEQLRTKYADFETKTLAAFDEIRTTLINLERMLTSMRTVVASSGMYVDLVPGSEHVRHSCSETLASLTEAVIRTREASCHTWHAHKTFGDYIPAMLALSIESTAKAREVFEKFKEAHPHPKGQN